MKQDFKPLYFDTELLQNYDRVDLRNTKLLDAHIAKAKYLHLDDIFV